MGGPVPSVENSHDHLVPDSPWELIGVIWHSLMNEPWQAGLALGMLAGAVALATYWRQRGKARARQGR